MTGFEPQVPAGWYQDQTMAATERYWDGNTWTDHVRPAVGVAPQPTVEQTRPQFVTPQPPAAKGGSGWKIVLGVIIGLFVLMLGGCALLIFGTTAAVESGRLLDEEGFEPLVTLPADDGVVIGDDQPGEPGTAADPLPYDQQTNLRFETFGDADGSMWSTTVGAPRDITDEVLAENPFNQPPPDGVVFVGFDVTMTLLEADKEPLSAGFNFSWELLGGATNAVYDIGTIETNSFGCGVVAGDFDSFAEVFVGGTVAGTVCIPLPEEDLLHPDTVVAIHFIDDSRAVFGS